MKVSFYNNLNFAALHLKVSPPFCMVAAAFSVLVCVCIYHSLLSPGRRGTPQGSRVLKEKRGKRGQAKREVRRERTQKGAGRKSEQAGRRQSIREEEKRSRAKANS